MRVVSTGIGNYTGQIERTLTDAVIWLTATSSTNSKMISWTDPLPEGSVLRFKQAGGGEWMTWVGNYVGDSLTIPGLKAGEYEVQLVDAQGKVLDSESGVLVIHSGMSASKALKPKAKVDKKATTISSVTVSWTDPTKADNTRYVVSYSIKVGTKWTVVEQFSTADNRYTFTGLNPNTPYRFSITAVNANGEFATNKKGTVTSKINITAKTKAYTAPKGFTDVGIRKTTTSNSITLTWKNSPFPETSHYEVRDAVSGRVLATLPALATTGNFSWTYNNDELGLQPNTTYKFEIRAVSDLLDGLKSKVAKVSAKTKKA